MRETNFIKQNKEKWIEFEAILNQPKKNPDKLSELFVHMSDDLSYSRTFYPNRSVKLYLNNLTQKVFNNIYRNKKQGWKKFAFFWKEELPQLVYQSRKQFLLSFIVFFLSAGIGVLSAANDPDFTAQILGKQYVNMTRENIKSGDPMKVYKEGDQGDTFLRITKNNLLVAFRTFLFGIFASIGTIGALLYNGIMVGVFQYYFYQMESANPGVLKQSLLTIWMHGTLEISSIIIAGAAGLTLGKGLLFPGTYTRLQAFQLSARRGLKLMVGIAPVITFAAFIESFVTRYTDVPDIMRIAVIAISLAFILGYFVWYPYVKSRKGSTVQLFEYRLPSSIQQDIDLKSIKDTGEIFSDIFLLYKQIFKKILWVSLVLSGIAITIIKLFFPELFTQHSTSSFSAFGFAIQSFFGAAVNSIDIIIRQYDYDSFAALMPLNSITISVIALIVFSQVIKKGRPAVDSATRKSILSLSSAFFKTLIPLALVNAILLILPSFWGFLLFFFLLPFILLWSFIMIVENKNIISGVPRMSSLLAKSGGGRVISIYLMCALVSFILLFLTSSSLSAAYIQILSWNLPFSPETIAPIWQVLFHFMIILSINLIIPVISAGIGILYFSLVEINEAAGLKALIDTFGTKKNRLIQQ